MADITTQGHLLSQRRKKTKVPTTNVAVTIVAQIQEEERSIVNQSGAHPIAADTRPNAFRPKLGGGADRARSRYVAKSALASVKIRPT